MTTNKSDERSYSNSKYSDLTLKCSPFINLEIKGVATAAPAGLCRVRGQPAVKKRVIPQNFENFETNTMVTLDNDVP